MTNWYMYMRAMGQEFMVEGGKLANTSLGVTSPVLTVLLDNRPGIQS